MQRLIRGVREIAGVLMIVTAGVMLCVAAGCERQGPETRAVGASDEVGASEDTASAPAGDAVSGDGAPDVDSAWPWRVPEGWVLDPEPRRMRLATYVAPDAGGDVEIAVTRFPGRVGGVLPNVNRWRGQMGLDTVDEAGLEDVIERFEADGFDGYQTRLESGSEVMLAAAVYEASGDQTYFVRATVDDAEAADRIWPALTGMARSIMDGEG